MYKSLYVDTDSIKTFETIEQSEKMIVKQMLNSVYGSMITNYKEKDMRIKDFIVLHADGQPLMVKKDSITTISKMADGTTRVECIGTRVWITDDKYEDVIKKLFEI